MTEIFSYDDQAHLTDLRVLESWFKDGYVEFRSGSGVVSGTAFLPVDQVVKLRDALNDWLDS